MGLFFSKTYMRETCVYLSGMTFSLGWWFFVDSVLYSSVVDAGKIHITLVDWIPCILSTAGMLMVNSVDKDRLVSSSFTYTRYDMVWKERLLLFLGFSLLAGGVAGSFTVLIIKYLVHNYPFEISCLGIENTVANCLIALR